MSATSAILAVLAPKFAELPGGLAFPLTDA